MPIYEFYCSDCHTIFNFLARKTSSKRPGCPRCERPRLERRASRFAISTGRTEAQAGNLGDLDEASLEQAMTELAGDASSLDENDPKQMAGMMRKLIERTGMPLGDGMDEAIRRLEAGEDPERIEEEIGDLLEADPGERMRRLTQRFRPPSVDSTLHEL